ARLASPHPSPSTSSTQASTQLLRARRRFLRRRRSPALPRSTLHQSPKPPFHLKHATHRESKNHRLLSARAVPKQSSTHSETHPRTGSLLQKPGRSAHNLLPVQSPFADACFQSSPSVPSRRRLSTFLSSPCRPPWDK